MLNELMMCPVFRTGIKIEPKMKMDLKEADGKYLVKAEIPGVASRSFTLADEIDQSQVQAKYSNGVHELTLPKKPGASRNVANSPVK